jgi:hypothetical protein
MAKDGGGGRNTNEAGNAPVQDGGITQEFQPLGKQ